MVAFGAVKPGEGGGGGCLRDGNHAAGGPEGDILVCDE